MDWGPKKQFDAPLSYGRAVAVVSQWGPLLQSSDEERRHYGHCHGRY